MKLLPVFEALGNQFRNFPFFLWPERGERCIAQNRLKVFGRIQMTLLGRKAIRNDRCGTRAVAIVRRRSRATLERRLRDCLLQQRYLRIMSALELRIGAHDRLFAHVPLGSRER